MADHKLGKVEEEGENGFELMIDLRRNEPGMDMFYVSYC